MKQVIQALGYAALRENLLKNVSDGHDSLTAVHWLWKKAYAMLAFQFSLKAMDLNIIVVVTTFVTIMNGQLCAMHVVIMKLLLIMSKLLHDSVANLFLFLFKSGACLWPPFTGGLHLLVTLPNLQKQGLWQDFSCL